MVTWHEVSTAEPEFARRVRALFEARRHHTLATLRRDGAPRISGTEVEFTGGEVTLGMMPGSVKARDLRRDPRLALHSATADPPPGNDAGWTGEAKLAGRAVEVPPAEPGPGAPHSFRIEISEVVITRLNEAGNRLLIESWHPGRGYERRERE